MKKLLIFTLLNTLSMLLLMVSRLPLEDDGFDWLFIGAILLIVVTWAHFFWERNRLNKLK